MTLTKNEIKNIIATTRKVTSQERGFLNFLRPSMTAGLPLMKNVLMPLAKSFFIPFGLTAGMAATDAAMEREIFGSGTIASIISNKKMEDIMKIVKSLVYLSLQEI